MVLECSESRMYGNQFRPHDGAGLLRPLRVNEYGGGSRYMYHRRSEPRETLNV